MAAEAGAPAVGGEPEPCATCGAPMAADQRYCLECGTRRAHLGGVFHSLRASDATVASTAALGAGVGGAAGTTVADVSPGVGAPLGAGAHGGQPGGMAAPPAQAPRASGATAVIAGVGVLLLSMGVGVLIGRSAGSSPSKAPAPQVISVASPGTGAAGTPSTTASTPIATAKPAHSPASSSSSSTLSKKAITEGVGQVPNKPAPPSVLKNLQGGSGQSYEQKSKSLPNVVSTG